MRRLFIYSTLFQRQIMGLKDAEERSHEIENVILDNPEVGDLVPGTNGVRKFRLVDASRGKGKRGGTRILFLDIPHAEKTYLLFFLRKGEAEDVTSDEKKMIRNLVAILKKENQP